MTTPAPPPSTLFRTSVSFSGHNARPYNDRLYGTVFGSVVALLPAPPGGPHGPTLLIQPRWCEIYSPESKVFDRRSETLVEVGVEYCTLFLQHNPVEPHESQFAQE